jgi:acyl dehydratase
MSDSNIKIGYMLPVHTQDPINRATLALFAGASNDHIPIHIDSDFARSAGRDDVFAHGMLSMAYLGQLLTRWRPQSDLLEWEVRFVEITPLYAMVHSHGEVVEILEGAQRRVARIAIKTSIDQGTITSEGEALVAL